MKRSFRTALTVALLVPMPLLAQQGGPTNANAQIEAEHEQWKVDHAAWTAQHKAIANRLRAIATTIESDDHALARHGGEIAEHDAALKRNADTDTFERIHARLRSEHEEARIAHHDLMDAVRALEIIAQEDVSSRDVETNQTEPPASARK